MLRSLVGSEMCIRDSVHDLLGTATGAVGSNTLQVSASNAVTLFTTDPNYFNDWIAFPNPGSNVTLETRTPSRQYLLSTGDVAGRVAVRNITTNQNIVAPRAVQAAAPFTMTIDVNTPGVSDGDSIRLFYKPTNTPTMGYQLVTESMTVNGDVGGSDVIIHTAATPISPELYIDAI